MVHRITVPLLLLAALTFFAGLGRGAITDSDEAFYAESAREMVASGDWITPYYNYEPRFQKPVLYYWLTRPPICAGPTEFGARLWAAMAGLGLVLVTAACGRRWYDESTGPSRRRHRRHQFRLLLDRPDGAARSAADLLHHARDLGGAGLDARCGRARRASSCCWPRSDWASAS